MKRIAVLLAAAGASLALAGATMASPPALSVTPSSVHAGHKVVIRGSADGCPVGDTVTVISRAFSAAHEFAGVPAVFATVRANGTFRKTTTIPATKHHGTYTVTARCGGGNLGVLAHLTVTA